MAVPSTMLPLGTTAPPFALPDARGVLVRSDDLEGPALVVAFICNHCPFVRHLGPVLGTVARQLRDRGVVLVAITANDVSTHPEDGPEGMAATAAEFDWDFPYLHDESQDVAKAYRAACTPDLYVFDGDRRLVYRGQFDASRPSNDTPVTGTDLLRAVEAVLTGQPVPEDQMPSLGCSIKWKTGQEPDWA